jgi:hypothetical protein
MGETEDFRMSTTRRDLLKTAAAGAIGLGLAPRAFAQGAPQGTPQRPPRQAGPLPEGIAPAAKPLRILILGGTGFTGPHQVKYALARGHRLTLFNRGRNPYMWPGEVEELTGDRNTGDLASLKGREWDVCIDNPTTLPFWVRDAGQILKGEVGQYIFISTLSVHSSETEVDADESAPVHEYKGADPMLETVETLLGVRAATTAGAKLHWVPAAFLQEQKVRAWSDMPVWVPSSPQMAGFARRSNKRAIAAGLTFRPLAQTALDTLAWFKAQMPERQAKLAAGIKPEREREVLAAWAARKQDRQA